MGFGAIMANWDIKKMILNRVQTLRIFETRFLGSQYRS